MAEVQPLARRTVEAAAALRADVSKLEILKQLRVGMTAAEARAAGVTVLREDAAGIMTVGMFTIPRLDSSVVNPPKSECVQLCAGCVREGVDGLNVGRIYSTTDLHDAVAACPPTRCACSPPRGAPRLFVTVTPQLPLATALPPFPLPAAFDMVTFQETTFLLLPQRIERAMELVDAVTEGRILATHLSGPDGVGKSAVLLLAYLILVARGIPVAYIARTSEWVEALKGDPTCGNAFFLEQLWRQNADLIVKSPTLRAVFLDVIMDKVGPVSAVMPKLRYAVSDVLLKGKDALKVCGIAVLLDEVQNITKAVFHAAQVPDSKYALNGAGQYFADTWFVWSNKNYVFQRLSAASAHSLRDSNLPAGEAHRLRIMAPLADADREALQKAESSPAYVRDDKARQHVVFAAGNVLRSLVIASQLLPAKGAITQSHLSVMWNKMWGGMVFECQVWLNSLPSDKLRVAAADSVMSLLKGEQHWGSALVLYDTGIVYRAADENKSEVWPVSGMANAVILHVTSAFQREHRRHLSEFKDPSVRGSEFEMQVLYSLDPFQGLLQCKHLDGSGADALLVHSSFSLPFHKLEEVVPRDRGVLYRPFNRNYPCDGIIMSVDDSGELHIFIVECSVTDPCTRDRPDKVAKWFLADGIVRELQATYPRAAITILLCYPEALAPRTSLPVDAAALCKHDPLPNPTGGLQAAAAAASAAGSSAAATAAPAVTAPPAATSSVRIRVLDLHVLRTTLGVLA